MGAGLHRLNGIGPKVAFHMIYIYIIPIMIYGLEALILKEKDLNPLEQYYKNLLRQIQHLPDSTATPAIYLLLGAIPVQDLIHIKILTFFASIARRKNAVENELFRRQMAVKDMTSNSWVNQVMRLLHEYDFPSIFEIMNDPPEKVKWKKLVQVTVLDYWTTELVKKAETMVTLSYLDMSRCYGGMVLDIWEYNTDPLEAHMATVKAKLLLQRYPLASSHCAEKKKSNICQLCGEGEETMSHFIVTCQTLMKWRMKYFIKLYSLILKVGIPFPENEDDVTKLVLSPSTLVEEEEIPKFEEFSRRMIFKLHKERAVMMGGQREYCRCFVGDSSSRCRDVVTVSQ